jgi:hypothetical protein
VLERMWHLELCHTAGGDANDTVTIESSLVVSYNVKHTLTI